MTLRGIESRAAVAALIFQIVGLVYGADFVRQPLCVMNVDGTELREIAVPPGRQCGSPDWSRDGQHIAFDAWIPPYRDPHVFVVELATGELVDMGPSAFPSWSPDGVHLAYQRQSGVEFGTWIVQRDGTDAARLFSEGTHPRWSPDGKSIAYRVRSGDNMGEYNLLTGDHRLLFAEPSTMLRWGRSWSPDSKRIALTRTAGATEELLVIAATGEDRQMVVRHRGSLSSHVSWSPDGKHLLVGIYLPDNGPRHLHLIAVDATGQPRAIPNQDMEYNYCDGTWSPDGKQVAFSLKKH